jgi:hypothetical protein
VRDGSDSALQSGTQDNPSITVTGTVKSFIAPIGKGRIYVNGKEAASITTTGVPIPDGPDGLGPFTRKFVSDPMPIGNFDYAVTVSAVNALANVGSDSARIEVEKDEEGTITARNVVEQSSVPAEEPDPLEYAFHIRLENADLLGDVYPGGEDVAVSVVGLNGPISIKLELEGSSYGSVPMFFVPWNLKWPAGLEGWTDEEYENLKKTRIMAKFGTKPYALLEKPGLAHIRDEAIPTGVLLVDAKDKMPIDMVLPGNPEKPTDSTTYYALVGAPGSEGDEVVTQLESLGTNGQIVDPPQGNYPPASHAVTLARQSEDESDPAYNLYETGRRILALGGAFPEGKGPSDYPDLVVNYAGGETVILGLKQETYGTNQESVVKVDKVSLFNRFQRSSGFELPRRKTVPKGRQWTTGFILPGWCSDMDMAVLKIEGVFEPEHIADRILWKIEKKVEGLNVSRDSGTFAEKNPFPINISNISAVPERGLSVGTEGDLFFHVGFDVNGDEILQEEELCLGPPVKIWLVSKEEYDSANSWLFWHCAGLDETRFLWPLTWSFHNYFYWGKDSIFFDELPHSDATGTRAIDFTTCTGYYMPGLGIRDANVVNDYGHKVVMPIFTFFKTSKLGDALAESTELARDLVTDDDFGIVSAIKAYYQQNSGDKMFSFTSMPSGIVTFNEGDLSTSVHGCTVYPNSATVWVQDQGDRVVVQRVIADGRIEDMFQWMYGGGHEAHSKYQASFETECDRTGGETFWVKGLFEFDRDDDAIQFEITK